MNEINPPKWTRSSRCSGGNCVEVAKVSGGYLVRDSKRPDMSPLSFTDSEWIAFVQGVKQDEFLLS
ncbi:DUF397 domain-containing protein [Jidongwangia harbinensis]|uniref:DUF397 domain-containing protein n=1 Tax=Jidongwangia harbinensis TaxID=2878561 RepID=UPI001CD9D5B0|nr:DUF397 domain-containing protein [Jidongwangia harbinensis]MCA2214536.1 DUF397 domain-containing protein [Jidongwangia harbinensis]